MGVSIDLTPPFRKTHANAKAHLPTLAHAPVAREDPGRPTSPVLCFHRILGISRASDFGLSVVLVLGQVPRETVDMPCGPWIADGVVDQ